MRGRGGHGGWLRARCRASDWWRWGFGGRKEEIGFLDAEPAAQAAQVKAQRGGGVELPGQSGVGEQALKLDHAEAGGLGELPGVGQEFEQPERVFHLRQRRLPLGARARDGGRGGRARGARAVGAGEQRLEDADGRLGEALPAGEHGCEQLAREHAAALADRRAHAVANDQEHLK